MMRAPLRRCGGQALTEFLVIALALLPLFLLMPMVGKYQDISHATAMASRYVAFEAMAGNDGMSSYKAPAQLAQEVRRRFFGNSDAPIKTHDEAGDFKANQNLYWVDAQGKALIRNFSDVSVSFGAGHGPGHADGVSAGDDGKPFNLAPPQVGEQLGLKSGLYTANVSVVVASPRDIGLSYASTYTEFKDLKLTVTRHTSVLPDTWTARDPAQIESRINTDELFPGNRFSTLRPLLKAAVVIIESPGSIKTPELGALDFWRDEVPPDRLK